MPAIEGILDGFAKLLSNSLASITTSSSIWVGSGASFIFNLLLSFMDGRDADGLLSGGTANLGKSRLDSCHANHSPRSSLIKLSVKVLSSLQRGLWEQQKGQLL